jgi:hypothetical protein
MEKEVRPVADLRRSSRASVPLASGKCASTPAGSAVRIVQKPGAWRKETMRTSPSQIPTADDASTLKWDSLPPPMTGSSTVRTGWLVVGEPSHDRRGTSEDTLAHTIMYRMRAAISQVRLTVRFPTPSSASSST